MVVMSEFCISCIFFVTLGTLPKAEQKEHTKDEVKDIKADNPTIAPTNTEDDIIIIEGPKNETMDRDRKVKNDRISNLQLENKLLKSEISSMNEELAGSLQRIKELQNRKYYYLLSIYIYIILWCLSVSKQCLSACN